MTRATPNPTIDSKEANATHPKAETTGRLVDRRKLSASKTARSIESDGDERGARNQGPWIGQVHAGSQQEHARNKNPEEQLDRPDGGKGPARRNGQKLHGRAGCRHRQDPQGQQVDGRQNRPEFLRGSSVRGLLRRARRSRSGHEKPLPPQKIGTVPTSAAADPLHRREIPPWSWVKAHESQPDLVVAASLPQSDGSNS